MTDILSKEQRSYCMSRIKRSNTSPERMLRYALWNHGLRYRLNQNLPGKPDIVFPRTKIAIFIDGCFWHRCPQHYKKPKSNTEFWEKKITGNVARDRKIDQTLNKDGWVVLRFWEHLIKQNVESCIEQVVQAIQSRSEIQYH